VAVASALGVGAALAGPALAETTPDRLAVVEVGSIGTPPAHAGEAAPVRIGQVTVGNSSIGAIASLPTIAGGGEGTFTLANYEGFLASDEGVLSVAPDGSLLLAGYGATPGTQDVEGTSSSSVPRVVAEVAPNGSVSTPVVLNDAFNEGRVTSAVTDGTNVWVSGDGRKDPSKASVVATQFGSSTATPVSGSPSTASAVDILEGSTGKPQLVVTPGNDGANFSGDPGDAITTSNKGLDDSLFALGEGLPTAGASAKALFTTNSNSSADYREIPGQAVFLDLEGGAGADTAYVVSPDNLYKFRMVSGEWKLEADRTGGFGSDIAVAMDNGVANVYVSSGSEISVVQDTSPNSNGHTFGEAQAHEVLGAPNNVQFRGIALLPASYPQTPAITIGKTALANAVGDPTNPTLPVNVTDAAYPSGPFTFSLQATSGNEGLLDPAFLPDGAFAVTPVDANDFDFAFSPLEAGAGITYLTATAPDGSSATAKFEYLASEFTDTTSRYHYGGSDASTAIDAGDEYMFTADDENNEINLYPEQTSGEPIVSYDFSAKGEPMQASGFKDSERDYEASARVGNTAYWAGSDGNGKEGKAAPERNVVFATTISGEGANTRLGYIGQYIGLQEDMVKWDEANGDGLGANYLGFAHSAKVGVDPKAPNGEGMSIEGMEFAPNSTSEAYMGFRAPLEPANNRHLAMVIPVMNMNQLVQGNPQKGIHAQFGQPLFWNLGGMGIREMRKNADNQYLIIAGPPDAEPDFALYYWDGNTQDQPVKLEDIPGGTDGSAWEGIANMPNPLKAGDQIVLIGDRGDADIYDNGREAKEEFPVGSRSDTFTLPALPAEANEVGGEVPATLALSVGGNASFGTFTPGVAKVYRASSTAKVTSTAGGASLTVSDVDQGENAGHLLNGSIAMRQALETRAFDTTNPGNGFLPLGVGGWDVLDFTGPVTNDPVSLQYAQKVGANDPLRTGSYGITLTYTLSTTTP
jgi:hypothetical protein